MGGSAGEGVVGDEAVVGWGLQAEGVRGAGGLVEGVVVGVAWG